MLPIPVLLIVTVDLNVVQKINISDYLSHIKDQLNRWKEQPSKLKRVIFKILPTGLQTGLWVHMPRSVHHMWISLVE